MYCLCIALLFQSLTLPLTCAVSVPITSVMSNQFKKAKNTVLTTQQGVGHIISPLNQSGTPNHLHNLGF